MGKPSTLSPQNIRNFRRKIFRFYASHGRPLLFRHTRDPYAITVAEMMLQQTQVDRVMPKLNAWLARWPNWQALAKASTRELLTAWSGLGYNRRCLYLGRIAQIVVEEYGGRQPDDIALLAKLPGIGRYTSRAILIFAHDRRLATVDTNVRRVLIHEFGLPATTSRDEIEALATMLLPRKRVRDWHNALMDYAALRLPRGTARVPARQPQYKGSRRQIRGEIMRQLTRGTSVTLSQVARTLKMEPEAVHEAAQSLAREGIVKMMNGRVKLC